MPEVFHFLLLPGFSALGFISAIEPLRVANRFRPGLYLWEVLSLDGNAVLASNGMSVNVDGGLGEVPPTGRLFVIAGFDPLNSVSPMLRAWLRKIAAQGGTLGGIDTGAFVLAATGVVTSGRVTLHWEALDAFRERWPCIEATQELFEIDGRIITCAGGTASIDLMLDLIGQVHGSELAIKVSEQFVLGRIRPRQDHQRMALASRYGTRNKKLLAAIGAMEQHTEAPLSTLALADCAGVTRRQLERLFRLYLQETPSGFYLGIRLEKARQLLQQTDMSVTEVSIACGFELPSYFTRRYKVRFGRPPREDRSHRG